jgi:hypothetical protein
MRKPGRPPRLREFLLRKLGTYAGGVFSPDPGPSQEAASQRIIASRQFQSTTSWNMQSLLELLPGLLHRHAGGTGIGYKPNPSACLNICRSTASEIKKAVDLICLKYNVQPIMTRHRRTLVTSEENYCLRSLNVAYYWVSRQVYSVSEATCFPNAIGSRRHQC